MAFDPHGYTASYSRPGHILLMRHPQTVANETHAYLGQRNAALTELGQRQCQAAIEGIVSWAPDRIYSSPLDRCLAIARPASQRLECPLVIEERVMEMGFGVLENMTNDEAVEAGLCFPWGETADRWPAPGAESLEDFMQRCGSAARDLARLCGKTAVISHGGAIRAMLGSLFAMQTQMIWNIQIKNVNSTLLAVDEDSNVFLERFGIEPERLAFYA